MASTKEGLAFDSDALTTREVLRLIVDCSSQEWQEPNGKRMGATDNMGRRMWFISDDLMKEAHAALARVEG